MDRNELVCGLLSSVRSCKTSNTDCIENREIRCGNSDDATDETSRRSFYHIGSNCSFDSGCCESSHGSANLLSGRTPSDRFHSETLASPNASCDGWTVPLSSAKFYHSLGILKEFNTLIEYWLASNYSVFLPFSVAFVPFDFTVVVVWLFLCSTKLSMVSNSMLHFRQILRPCMVTLW